VGDVLEVEAGQLVLFELPALRVFVLKKLDHSDIRKIIGFHVHQVEKSASGYPVTILKNIFSGIGPKLPFIKG